MPGLLRGVARTAVIAGTATAVSNRVSRRQAGRWAAQEEQQYAADQYQQQQQQQQQPVQGPTTDDMDLKIDQLKQLGELRSQGLLSEAEFQAQKARILAA